MTMARFLRVPCVALLGAAWTLSALCPSCARADAVRVSVVQRNGRHVLERNGTPFAIRGVGGDGSKELLAQCGGNSFRTWGAERLGEALDEAQRLGLTVAAGIWLGHERHGFRYTDPDQVAKQQDMVRDVVQRYRKHPALLMWSLGNEMEGDGTNAAVWTAVNSLAAMVKRLDPEHPVMTVIAEVSAEKVLNLHRLCPEVDVVGINSYAGAATVADRYVKAGGTKPFVLTEFGPPGTWEVEKTPWGRPIEPTSSEKAEWYRRAWRAVAASPLSLGGYAFTWGHKQEATATWFGMLLPDGSRLASVDVMTEIWSGKPPANRAPQVSGLAVAGSPDVEPGSLVKATITASDPEGDPLTAEWALREEPDAYGWGGDAEAVPRTIEGAVSRASLTEAEIRMPKDPGDYRLFVYVRDGRGGAATANVPLRVKGERRPEPSKQASLPLVVYAENEQTGRPYVPSGWMGKITAMKLDPASTAQPYAGKVCMRVEYSAPNEWAGVVWQHPENDWGDRPGGWNLTGASRLTFRARGERGGETVTFHVGIIGPDKPFADSSVTKLEGVRLTPEWREYVISLDGKDLSRIKTGFGWTVSGQGRPVVFYLDDVRFER